MKYYYLNKIAMAVLVALLLFFGTRTLMDVVYQEQPPEKPGYEVAGTGDKVESEKKEPTDESAAFIVALNKADPAKGEQDIAACKVCHSFDKGGPTMIGPNLYGIVGKKIASAEGFNYSAALKGKGGNWTFDDMGAWLVNPQQFAAGTSMAYPGIPDVKKRADLIAYLNKNSDDPLPIPAPKEEPAAEEATDESAAKEADTGQPEVLALLATADAAKGDQAAALCKACHSFEAGGANMVGPNLHNVVGADIARVEGFSYSPALKGKEGNWTHEALDVWLANPQEFVAGNYMAYPGIPDAKKRADIIAYMISQTENPPPVPSAEAPPAEEAKPTDEEAEPADEAKPTEEEAAPAEEPAAADDTISNPPTVSEDAPSEPHQGEAPSPNQPQPVVPEDSGDDAAASDDATATEEMGEVTSVPPTVSEDAPSEPHKGEAPSQTQPQPFYPEEDSGSEADAGDSSSAVASSSNDSQSSQPQPVYPDGPPDGL